MTYCESVLAVPDHFVILWALRNFFFYVLHKLTTTEVVLTDL